MMDPTLVSAGVLFGGFVGLLAFYWGQAIAPRRFVRARLGEQPSSGGGLAPALRDVTGRVPLIDRLPLSAVARAQMEVALDRAGVPLRVSEYLALRMAGSICGSALGVALTGALGLPLWLGGPCTLLLLVFGWSAPGRWVESRRRRRVSLVESQLPDALTLVAKSLRAGAGLLQAIAFAADETPAPLGPEFARVLRDLRLGADTEGVFLELSRRVGSQDLDIAVTAIIIQRSVGGNLAEILANVVRTIRERERLRQEVGVLTSRQRLTARMMAAMPVVIAVLFTWLNPEAGRLLLTTFAGQVALGIGVAFEVLGLIVIQRLAIIEI